MGVIGWRTSVLGGALLGKAGFYLAMVQNITKRKAWLVLYKFLKLLAFG